MGAVSLKSEERAIGNMNGKNKEIRKRHRCPVVTRFEIYGVFTPLSFDSKKPTFPCNVRAWPIIRAARTGRMDVNKL
jgi:hypothetical protein